MNRFILLFVSVYVVLMPIEIFAYNNILVDSVQKVIDISVSNRNLDLRINYASGCRISQLKIKGINVLSDSGIYTGFRTKSNTYTSCLCMDSINVKYVDNKLIIENILYGDKSICVEQSWIFEVKNNKILWRIDHRYSNLAELEEVYMPQWNFMNLSTWKGGILNNGGMVWCKYLKKINDTYGVHTGGVTFWNSENGNALRIEPRCDGRHIASKYSQSNKNEFTCSHFITDEELQPRYDLNRFVSQKADVFRSFTVKRDSFTVDLDLEYVNYVEEYSRGTLPNIDAIAIRELMNTTGRYGVVDNGIVGANGWITNWKCLHEPFFSQIGLALNDSNYIKNLSISLDRERDFAITPDGRVLSRWHGTGDDQMPGTFNYKTGYYEAMWGYTIDSQTGYVINVSELFDLNGDIEWLQSHKKTCEAALNWMIKRDSNNNGIFEMMNDSTGEAKASDWLDIVWASFENAFVNSQMYEALNLWSMCECVLGDYGKANYYKRIALNLKTNFNKSINEGGFWSPDKKQYVYWRDKNGSIHGDNLVTPVNFAVIAFGLCDDKKRISQILEQIESRTVREKLFHWPLCFDSFKREEVSAGNWPFPTYENGDIFPTWGYLGVRAYIGYDKSLALKYICNILDQYKRDGLSSQRYSRKTQKGQGSDILAGICTSVTGLYRDIYGIRPKWNRMGLEPNILEILNGTEFNYILRGTNYCIRLSVDDYEMETDSFLIKSSNAFGAFFQNECLAIYPQNREKMVLKIYRESSKPIEVTLKHYFENDISWEMNTSGKYKFVVEGLNPSLKYKLVVQGKTLPIEIGDNGKFSFTYPCKETLKIRLYR